MNPLFYFFSRTLILYPVILFSFSEDCHRKKTERSKWHLENIFYFSFSWEILTGKNYIEFELLDGIYWIFILYTYIAEYHILHIYNRNLMN